MKTKARRIMDLLNAAPNRTNSQIAREVGCHTSYVYMLREKMAHVPACTETYDEAAEITQAPTKLTGGSSSYYKLRITRPTSGLSEYTVECNDIIEALGMSYAEGNAFKAVWRHAILRHGRGKPGSTPLYEAEKVEFFGRRMVEQAKGSAR